MSSASLRNQSVIYQGNTVLVQPKLQFRWRVSFSNFGENSIAITRQVMDMSRPKVKFEEIKLPVYNSTVYVAGKYSWDPITMKIRDDANSEVQRSIAKQLSKQLDFENMASAASGFDYKFATKIEILDGGNGSMGPTVLETWDLFGCYLSDVGYEPINYETSAAMTISMTIRYDNAAQTTKQGEEAIGSASQQHGTGDLVNAGA